MSSVRAPSSLCGAQHEPHHARIGAGAGNSPFRLVCIGSHSGAGKQAARCPEQEVGAGVLDAAGCAPLSRRDSSGQPSGLVVEVVGKSSHSTASLERSEDGTRTEYLQVSLTPNDAGKLGFSSAAMVGAPLNPGMGRAARRVAGALGAALQHGAAPSNAHRISTGHSSIQHE